MRRSAANTGHVAIWMAVASACVVASVIAAWPTGDDPGASPVDAIDARFPDGNAVSTSMAPRPAGEDAVASPGAIVDARFPAKEASRPRQQAGAGESDELQRALFSPHPAYPPPAAQAAEPVPVQAAVAAAPVAAAAPAGATKPPVAPAVRQTAAVLNDAQIASIKGRLNLTPDQERMWPAVEVALRKLAYAKRDRGSRKSGARRGGRELAEIDPASDDVQHLKSAAAPLIMSFNDDQERELRVLAQIAGLDKLIPAKNADHAF